MCACQCALKLYKNQPHVLLHNSLCTALRFSVGILARNKVTHSRYWCIQNTARIVQYTQIASPRR